MSNSYRKWKYQILDITKCTDHMLLFQLMGYPIECMYVGLRSKNTHDIIDPSFETLGLSSACIPLPTTTQFYNRMIKLSFPVSDDMALSISDGTALHFPGDCLEAQKLRELYLYYKLKPDCDPNELEIIIVAQKYGMKFDECCQ